MTLAFFRRHRKWFMVLMAAITLLSGILYLIDNWTTVRELYDASDRATESE